MSETQILIAIGAAIVGFPLIAPWVKDLIAKFKGGPVVLPDNSGGLKGACKQLRYYLALQPREVQEPGFKAIEVLEGIISEQPRLHGPTNLEH